MHLIRTLGIITTAVPVPTGAARAPTAINALVAAHPNTALTTLKEMVGKERSFFV